MKTQIGIIKKTFEVTKKTFEVTTQLAKVDIRLPLRIHFKSRFLQANVNRLKEKIQLILSSHLLRQLEDTNVFNYLLEIKAL